LETDKNTHMAKRLYFYTNGESPLKKYHDKALFMLSSETGDEDVKEEVLFYFDYKDRKVKRHDCDYQVEGYYSNSRCSCHWTDDDDYTDFDYDDDDDDEISETCDDYIKEYCEELKKEIQEKEAELLNFTLTGKSKEVKRIEQDIFTLEAELQECKNELTPIN